MSFLTKLREEFGDKKVTEVTGFLSQDHENDLELQKQLFLSIKKFKPLQFQEISLKILEDLILKSEYSTIYELQSSTLYLKEEVYLAEALWNLGRIKEYFDMCKQICTEVLSDKYYGIVPVFKELHHARCQSKEFYQNFLLMDLAERGEERELEKLLDISSYALRAEVLAHFEFNSLKLNFYLLKSKLIECLKGKLQLTGKEMVQYFLLCSKVSEMLLLFELDEVSDGIKEKLVALARENKIKATDLLEENSKLRDLLRPTMSVSRKETTKAYEYEKLSPMGQNIIEAVNKSYSTSSDEERLISQFKYEEVNLHELEELIISFVTMDYFKLGLVLANKLSEGPNKLYYKAVCCLGMNQYAETIYYINEYLNVADKTQDITPFLKIKLQAYIGLNNKPEILRLRRVIGDFDI